MNVNQTTNIYMQLTSCRVVSSTNLNANYYNGQTNNGVGAQLLMANAGQLMVDGINLNVNDRVLVIGQTSTNANGLYVVLFPGSPSQIGILQRSSDWQCIEQIKPGQYIPIYDGYTFSGEIYVVINPIPNALGIDPINIISSSSSSGGPFVPIAGATMTGPLILSGPPTDPNGAVTKAYADGIAAGVPWQINTSGPVNMLSDQGYISNGVSQITYNLPSSVAVGDIIDMSSMSSSGFFISQGSSQYIIYGNQTSTVGVGGSLSSSATGDCISLLCVQTNVGFIALSSIGNLTII